MTGLGRGAAKRLTRPQKDSQGYSGVKRPYTSEITSKKRPKREIMSDSKNRVRVLFSFPLRLGADRICGIAWQQVNGLAAAGADVLVFPASISRPVASNVRVSPTLARGKLRIPYKLVGTMRAT